MASLVGVRGSKARLLGLGPGRGPAGAAAAAAAAGAGGDAYEGFHRAGKMMFNLASALGALVSEPGDLGDHTTTEAGCAFEYRSC
jgi:hypothetical protein